MAYNISICFRNYNGKAVFQNVEKVEALPVGRGILSVIKDGKNKCFLLDTIDFYEIDDVVSEWKTDDIQRGERMSRLDDVISDVGYILDCLQALRSIWETGHDCNTCTKTCDYRQWGRQVTWNCPLWESEE